VPIGAVDQPVAGTPTVKQAYASTGALYGNVGVVSQYGLAYTVTSGPTNGGVVVYSPTGGFTYTPTAAARTAAGDPNAPASAKVDQFTVTATNGVYSTTQTVTVTISPVITTDGSVTAASKYGWGTPNASVDFTSPASLQGWGVYDGPGNAGYGVRTPDAISFANNVMTITGDAQGTTGGMAAPLGQQYGMWEVRMKVPVGAPGYSPVLLLWPDAENWPTGGEVDFAEGTTDGSRQTYSGALHYSAQDQWDPAVVGVDATQWHNYAVEWTPTKITYFIDGVPWKTYTDTSKFPPGPMHLAIQLDVHTLDLAGGATMQVAWARQYSLPTTV
jgi:hypothetical protein